MDKSHCGPNGFSPPAPDWICNSQELPVHTVPEPDTFGLVAVALLIVWFFRRNKLSK